MKRAEQYNSWPNALLVMCAHAQLLLINSHSLTLSNSLFVWTIGASPSIQIASNYIVFFKIFLFCLKELNNY